MASVKISETELLTELASALSAAPENALTADEIATRLGVCRSTARDRLRALHLLGRLSVHRIVRQAMDGKRCQVPAYTIKPASKKP